MLVYRAQRRQDEPARLLAAIRDGLAHLAPGHAGVHDRVVRLLIALGELEAGVADSLHAEADAPHPVTAALRRASVAAGHLLWHSWRHGQHETLSAWAARVRGALAALEAATLPRTVVTSVPEGYAYYGLFPETYLCAAVRCARALRMERAVCVGIRSIGTSLSAVVSAALEELGIQVLSLTVRPRGHPFDRRLRLAPALEALLRDHAAEPFLVVDEGPGLSGSSFAGTARALSELGVSDDRIVLLPSWRTDGHSLRSEDARTRWHRHRQFAATFEEVWVETGRLADLAPASSLSDLSAGKWRPLLLHQAHYPAVQRQHERRKLLARHPSGGRAEQPDLLLRFAGLGARGDARLRRAHALADAGFTPAVLGLGHGFLIQEFPAGAPGWAGQGCADELAGTMARYLAHLRRCHPAAVDAAPDLRELLVTNVTEGLGEAAAERLAVRFPPAGAPPQEPPTALDGRMLPHEWVRTGRGFFKADAVDHHDDHFYPGPQDIAWDVAGTCLEFGLVGDARRGFLARYIRESGDAAITHRLPYHAVAYLAFRLGYVSVAAESLGDDPDAARFRGETVRYRALLAAELRSDAPARWHG
jgi:hypothetical protein